MSDREIAVQAASVVKVHPGEWILFEEVCRLLLGVVKVDSDDVQLRLAVLALQFLQPSHLGLATLAPASPAVINDGPPSVARELNCRPSSSAPSKPNDLPTSERRRIAPAAFLPGSVFEKSLAALLYHFSAFSHRQRTRRTEQFGSLLRLNHRSLDTPE